MVFFQLIFVLLARYVRMHNFLGKSKQMQAIYQSLDQDIGAIALSYPSRVRLRATVKLSAVFFHDESS